MRVLTIFLILITTLNLKAADLREELSLLYNAGRYKEAISLCEKKLKSSADKFYYLNLALLKESEGDISSALSLVKEAFFLYSRDKEVIFHLARTYLLSSHFEEASSFFERYLKFEPQDKRAYFYLGLSYELQGKRDRAEVFYRRALELDSYFVLPLIRLADLYLRQGRDKEAEKLLTSLKEIEPGIKSVYKKLALLYFKEAKFLLSFKEASKFLEMTPTDREIQRVLRLSREKLGEEFFRREAEKIVLAWKKKTAKVSSFVEGNIPRVRVCLAQSVSEFMFKVTEKAFLYSRDVAIFELAKDTLYKVRFIPPNSVRILDESGRVILDNLKTPLRIGSENPNFLIGLFGLSYAPAKYWSAKRESFFRGSLVINSTARGLTLINHLNLEEYLYGVLPYEVSSSWPKEVLCAQAILARTKAWLTLQGKSNKDYDFSNTYLFQVYLGASEEKDSTNQAVDQTRGLILVDKRNFPFDVYYSSNCGGYTQNQKREQSKGVLDSDKELKVFPLSPFELYGWLTDEPDVFCKTEGLLKSRFRWQRFYTGKEFFRILGRNAGLRNLKGIEILERNFSSHISKIKIKLDDDDSIIVEPELKIREIFDDLRSSLFWIETIYSGKGEPLYFIIWGGGFGHGKGLCQFGAKGMAERGYSYQDILKHYFPQSHLKKVY